MAHPVPTVTEDERPTVPVPRRADPIIPADEETFRFVDIEHGIAEEAELEAAANAWDGFL